MKPTPSVADMIKIAPTLIYSTCTSTYITYICLPPEKMICTPGWASCEMRTPHPQHPPSPEST